MGVGRQPNNANIVSCKWVFKLKKNATWSDRCKDRLAARGFSQKKKKKIDYEETFAQVVKREMFRLSISLAVKLKLNVYHMDVKTAQT
jgi:hypothetical protein